MTDQAPSPAPAAPSTPLILHVGHSITGRLKRRWEAGEYTPQGADKPIDEAVLELDNGHAFLDRAGAMRELSPVEEHVLASMEEELRTLVTGAVVVLAKSRVQPAHALQVVTAVLRLQLRALNGNVDLVTG